MERSDIENTYKSVRLEIVPAAQINVAELHLGPDDRFFAWGQETQDFQAPVYMLEPGTSTLLVPVGTPVIPIISRGGRPVWIGRPVTPVTRDTVLLTRSDPADDRMNVLAWIRLPTRRSPPDLTAAEPVIEIDGQTFKPSIAFGPVRFGSFNAAAFYDVPKRRGRLCVADGTWHAKPIAFAPGKEAHLFISDPLLLTPQSP